MVRARGRVAPTLQEEAVMDVLRGLGVVFDRDYVVDYRGWLLFYDFRFVVGGVEVFVECGFTLKGGSRGVDEVGRKAALMDFKFRALKDVRPRALAVALLEAPRADLEAVRRRAGLVLVHADLVFHSLGEFEGWVRGVVGGAVVEEGC